MKVVSVNVGRCETVTGPGFEAESGIVKRSVPGPVAVGSLGLESDEIVHLEHHGGPDQAVYVYRTEDYDWWSTELGRTLDPGLFGENLTLSGLPGADPVIGTRIRFANLELEVTAPRIPCATFSARMNDPDFIKRFKDAARLGAYCRVIAPGHVEAGESFTFSAPADSDTAVSVVDLFRAHYRGLDADEVRRFLAAPIDHRTRTWLEHKLRELRKSNQ